MYKKICAVFVGVCLTLLAVGCGNTNSSTDANGSSSADKTKLTVAINGDMGTLDPAGTMDNMAVKITYPTYERLVEFNGASTDVKPGLAAKWETSSDGLTWTFHLVKGHKFVDGTEVDSQAVKFSFERILAVKKGPADTYKVIQTINTPDKYTVQFVLNSAFPQFLSTLATNYGGIVNPKVMTHEQNGDKAQTYLSNHTDGSGPYQLTEWKKGSYIHLSLNPNYSKKPTLKDVYFKLVSDASAARLELEKGDVDIAEGINIDQIDKLKSNQNISIVKKPSLLVDYVYLNCTKGNAALQNPKVRQAISYAVDYNSIISEVMHGYASPIASPVPKGLWGYNPSAFKYTKNVQKAKSLLKEAGVSNVQLTLLYSDRFPNWEQEALILQSNLKDIGITVNLSKVAYATMRDMLDSGKFDLAMGVWSPDYADPYMFMNYWFDSNDQGLAGNRAFYVNPAVDDLIRKAASITDRSQRTELYNQAQKIVIDDAPYVYLYQKQFILPMNKNVKGFVYNPMLEGIYNLADMSK
ncbi:ABC transporter substrate-binding protein [Clostridium luticellarii]|jgi:peptide/nickel transport system substrate-binding protein|uniref:Putative D,D-dipeptide-binding periplasmic protein DdpA n=1 Tax=Clostridium luticellarii TaxID=1691940 RepID=A0A2T0BHI7_9CLOT|nr:ABC transporter substrate-binding protein [Clostridium luticellarii]MCI1943911.1 ABC transporter substrate-binding protein [Clostridium luticellarii]MCI1967172.1 ABC transporter substrate-binding protein [Clostridium luticellarii]MCI1994539.1 ABC transporter substrate-binding protein [Clostridium luticellarii]MCI2038508.1 ABC transporter substrate-binding protein [Clostridium luticellarii]PRR83356.1 putative D,D-dipeptide-binding periplasmic protein DdpA precursor [Clostridium luticellarii]